MHKYGCISEQNPLCISQNNNLFHFGEKKKRVKKEFIFNSLNDFQPSVIPFYTKLKYFVANIDSNLYPNQSS